MLTFAGKVFFRSPILYCKLYRNTNTNPSELGITKRRQMARLIKKAARTAGISSRATAIELFSSKIVNSAPNDCGIYRFYKGEELVYIGCSRGIRIRFKEHLVDCQNPKLDALIKSGSARVQWYICPFYGWMESFELTEYEEEHGYLPPYNKTRGGVS